MADVSPVDPYDVTSEVVRTAADVVEHLQEQGVSVWRVEYDADPRDPRRQPVMVEVVTDYDGDPFDPRDPQDGFPADLSVESEHGDADVYVESAPDVDVHGPEATAIWDLAVFVTLPEGDDG